MGCIYDLVQVNNSSVWTPLIKLVPIESEFPKVFPNNLSTLPSKREIDFDVDILPDIHPISIPPYRMSLAELKELKTSYKIFLIKVSFVKKKDVSRRMCINYAN